MLKLTRNELADFLEFHAMQLRNDEFTDFEVANKIQNTEAIIYLINFIEKATGIQKVEIIDGNLMAKLIREIQRLKHILKENKIIYTERK